MLRHAVRINSISEIAITKLDVLDVLSTIKLCVAYETDGERTTRLPYHQSVLHRAVPIYEEFEGWQQDLSEATSVKDLPDAARRYIARIAEVCGVPVTYVGVGPEREQYVRFAA